MSSQSTVSSTSPLSPPHRWFAVVPAAGRSARMGQPKLLLPWDDSGGENRTLIERVIGAWQCVSQAIVVVTVHPDDDALAEVCRAAGAEVVRPSEPPPDMKASILAALEHLRIRYAPADNDVWLTAPADLPELSPQVIEQLLKAYDRDNPQIVRPQHAGRFGHPTLFPWSSIAHVASIPEDRGLNELFERLPFSTIESNSACLAADVDTPDDYRRLRDR